jgi:hypothetical protein
MDLQIEDVVALGVEPGDLLVVRHSQSLTGAEIRSMAESLSPIAERIGVQVLLLPADITVEHLRATDPDLLDGMADDAEVTAAYELGEHEISCVRRVVKFLRSLFGDGTETDFNEPSGLGDGAAVEVLVDHAFPTPGGEGMDGVVGAGTIGVIVGELNAPHSYRVEFSTPAGMLYVEIAAGQLRKVE